MTFLESTESATLHQNDPLVVETGAEQLIKASCAAIDQVHDYALKELLRLEELIARTKLSIEEKKNRSTQETRTYVESVDNALRAAQAIEEAVTRIDAGS